MNEPAPPSEPESSGLVIAVIRTGGVAGIARRWRITPPEDEAGQWLELIERCPWREPRERDSGADRFVWSIRASTATDEHESDVAESELTGAWRELVDAVREAAATAPDAPSPRA